jgi:Holliday junction resolvase RusA-like endonuclease
MVFLIQDKIKPYTRMTQRGKFVSPQAQEYLRSRAAIQWQLKEQMRGRKALPDQTPLAARIEIVMEGGLHRSDLDNQVKALLDAAQGIVFRNDLWIDEVHAERRVGDRYFARMVVKVKP